MDPSQLPAPGAALRWRPRFAAGLPNALTVLARPALQPAATTVSLTLLQEWSSYIRWAKRPDGTPITTDAQGFHLPRGVVRIQFAQPMVLVDLASGHGAPVVAGGAAYHFPFVVTRLAASATPPSLGSFVADAIDVIDLEVATPGVLTQIRLIPIGAMISNTWNQLHQFSWAAGQYPGATTPAFAEQRQLVQALVAASNPTPMAQRTLQASGSGGTVAVPELALLLLAAYAPSIAEQFGLLYRPVQGGAGVAQQFDYAVVGNWGARAALPSPVSADFAGLAHSGLTTLGTTYVLGSMVINSFETIMLATSAVAGASGMRLGKYPVLFLFSTPVQAVQFARVAAVSPIVASAFSQTDEALGQRIVDWVHYDQGPFATLQADRIDAVLMYGEGQTLQWLNAVTADPALAHAPSAAIDTVTSLCFAARNHPVPAAPAPVTAVALPDPVLANPNPSPTPLPARVNTAIEVGLSFAGTTPGPTLDYGPASYVIARGPSQTLQPAILVPKDDPLVLTDADTAAASTASAPAQDPWNSTASVSDAPNAQPIYYLDTVDLSATPGGATEVYSVKAMDIFGRLSLPAYSAALQVTKPGPPAPFNVAATVATPADPAQPTTPSGIQVSWSWPPDAALDTLADLTGFKIYSGPVAVSRGWSDGAIQGVSEAVAGDPTVPNSLPVFHATTSVSASGVDLATLPLAAVRVGSDHYVVCDGTASAQGKLNLRLYVNLSTPTARPAAGDAVRVFEDSSDPDALQAAASYANSVVVPSAGLQLTANNNYQSALALYLSAATGQLAWPAPDAHGVSRLMIGVSACNASGESAVAGPVTVSYVNTHSDPPPVPGSESEADQFTQPPDVTGHCRYSYAALVLPAGNYHVCRTFDRRLLAALASAASGTLAAPAARSSALSAADFTAALAQPFPTDPESLSNLQLHAIANLVGLESAFEQVTATPIAVPANAAQPATAFTQAFLDATLPGGGSNRYLYRLRSVSLNGALGAWGWVSPPVRLFPLAPVRPMFSSAVINGYVALLHWNPNPEAHVDRYRVYQATDEAAGADERTMTLIAEILAIDAATAAPAGQLGASVAVPQGSISWFRLVAVANWPAPVGLVPSAPSDAVRLLSQSSEDPEPPHAATVAKIHLLHGGMQVNVTFTPNLNPTTRYQLWRKPAGGTRAVPVSAWVNNPATFGPAKLMSPVPATATPAPPPPPTPPAALADVNPLNASVAVVYQVAVTNAGGVVALSDEFPL